MSIIQFSHFFFFSLRSQINFNLTTTENICSRREKGSSEVLVFSSSTFQLIANWRGRKCLVLFQRLGFFIIDVLRKDEYWRILFLKNVIFFLPTHKIDIDSQYCLEKQNQKEWDKLDDWWRTWINSSFTWSMAEKIFVDNYLNEFLMRNSLTAMIHQHR